MLGRRGNLGGCGKERSRCIWRRRVELAESILLWEATHSFFSPRALPVRSQLLCLVPHRCCVPAGL